MTAHKVSYSTSERPIAVELCENGDHGPIQPPMAIDELEETLPLSRSLRSRPEIRTRLCSRGRIRCNAEAATHAVS